MPRILCLWFPRWPIQRQRAVAPECRARPLILTTRAPRGGDVVAECCQAAERYGVRSGMPLVEALALCRFEAKRNSARGDARAAAPRTIATALWSPEDDRAELERLADRCQQFSPLVGLEESPCPTALLMNVTGSAPRLGGEQALLEQLMATCERWGYQGQAAIADTVAAAWAFSHYLAEIPAAAGQPGPGYFIDPPRSPRPDPSVEWPEAWQALPVAALRIDADVCATLETLGIVRVGQLLALPRPGLRTRFGDALLRRLDQATGRVLEPIEACEAAPPLEVQYLLEHPTAQAAQLTAILRLLAGQLAHRLWQQNQGAIQLDCICQLQDRATVTVSVGLYQPSIDSEQFVRLLQTRWEAAAWTAPVVAVRLRASFTAELELTQEMLWGEDLQPDRQQLGQLIEQLSNRLGREAVVGVRLLADHQPERAVRWIPLTGTRPLAPASTEAARARHAPYLRPLHLEPTPCPLPRLTTAQDGRPVSFEYDRQVHRIRDSWGPERIETGWWRGKAIHRDYYRVQDQHGCCFWLFRDGRQDAWYLHGCFA